MSATLEIVNNLSMEASGVTVTAKQGTSTDDFSEAFSITVGGQDHGGVGSLATATVRTIYDDDDDFPIDWDYFFIWGDQDFYLQVIGSGTNVIFKCLAKVPFTLSYDSMLAAANTTIITGGSEPSLTDIDSIVIGNYSGNTMNFVYRLID